MKKPIISVLVPAYNVDLYIEKCISSIINQSFDNLEIIVVDDGSTDQTGNILDEFAKKDDRIKVVHKPNEGLVMARRDALALAEGNLVGFVDGDDWIEPNMYEKLFDAMQQTGADIVTSGRIIEEEDRSFALYDLIGPGSYTPLQDSEFCHNLIWDSHNHLWGITPNFWNKLFKKDVIIDRQRCINPDITYGEDDACVYGALAFADKVTVLQEALYHYRMRGDSMSHSADDYYMQKVNVLYLAMKKSFEGHPYEPILKSGLDLYMFEFVKRGVQSLWGIQVNCDLIPYKITGFDLRLKDRFVLYGAGKIGQSLYAELCQNGLEKNIIWIDKQFEKYRQKGLNVESQERLQQRDYQSVIVAVKNDRLFQEIKAELLAFGIPEEIIQGTQTRNTIEMCKRL